MNSSSVVPVTTRDLGWFVVAASKVKVRDGGQVLVIGYGIETLGLFLYLETTSGSSCY
jgi:hypothetical protein